MVMHYGKIVAGPKFSIDHPKIRSQYEQFFYYFMASQPDFDEDKRRSFAEKTTLDPKKAILLVGDIGVGKSVIMRVFNMIFRRYKYVHARRQIERTFKEFGQVEFLREYGYDLKMSLCIDDVGTEETEQMHYGNKISLIGELLLERYDLFKSQPEYVTHLVSNLTTNQMEERYGKRNFDRLKESSNLVTWTGASLRQA